MDEIKRLNRLFDAKDECYRNLLAKCDKLDAENRDRTSIEGKLATTMDAADIGIKLQEKDKKIEQLMTWLKAFQEKVAGRYGRQTVDSIDNEIDDEHTLIPPKDSSPAPQNDDFDLDDDPFHPKKLIDRIKRWWKYLGDPGTHYGMCPSTHED